MNHLDEAQLRRMLDEPGAFTPGERAHAASCETCAASSVQLRANADTAARAFAQGVTVETGAAYERVLSAAKPVRVVRLPVRYAGGLAAAAAIALALIFTPLGTYARSFLTIFEPQQFEPVRISHAELDHLRLLPQADKIGTQRVVRAAKVSKYASFAQAQQHLDFHPLMPAVLPAGLRARNVTYRVSTPQEMTYTFSAAKARAFAARSHKALPPMPAGLDGTTVRLQTGAVFETRLAGADKSFVDVVQMRAPKVTSSGAGLPVLERYILSMPNVPPELADQLRALGDIQNTVPVPVIIDKQTAHRVRVQGADGLAIGDNTGIGSGIMWQKNGVIYAVGGPVRMDDVVTVANGLK